MTVDCTGPIVLAAAIAIPAIAELWRREWRLFAAKSGSGRQARSVGGASERTVRTMGKAPEPDAEAVTLEDLLRIVRELEERIKRLEREVMEPDTAADW